MGCKPKTNEAVVKARKKFALELEELPVQIAQFPEPQQPSKK